MPKKEVAFQTRDKKDVKFTTGTYTPSNAVQIATGGQYNQ
jgi:hypothetical protein